MKLHLNLPGFSNHLVLNLRAHAKCLLLRDHTQLLEKLNDTGEKSDFFQINNLNWHLLFFLTGVIEMALQGRLPAQGSLPTSALRAHPRPRPRRGGIRRRDSSIWQNAIGPRRDGPLPAPSVRLSRERGDAELKTAHARDGDTRKQLLCSPKREQNTSAPPPAPCAGAGPARCMRAHSEGLFQGCTETASWAEEGDLKWPLGSQHRAVGSGKGVLRTHIVGLLGSLSNARQRPGSPGASRQGTRGRSCPLHLSDRFC